MSVNTHGDNGIIIHVKHIIKQLQQSVQSLLIHRYLEPCGVSQDDVNPITEQQRGEGQLIHVHRYTEKKPSHNAHNKHHHGDNSLPVREEITLKELSKPVEGEERRQN